MTFYSPTRLVQCGIPLQGTQMFLPWYATVLLALEAGEVILLRMLMKPDIHEAELMVSEKLDAFSETLGEIAGGCTPYGIIQNYRKRVAANTVRLRAV